MISVVLAQNYFDIDFFTGDIVCGKCRLQLYKKIKVDPVANGSEDESESIVNELLERTVSSLSQMTLSQSSSDDPSFRANITSTDDSTEDFEVLIKRTISTHGYCCLCNNTIDLTVIPQKALMQSFIKRRVFIPDGNRCCRSHLINKRFYDEALDLIRVHSNWTRISSVELSNMMENFSVECDSTLLDKMDDYRVSDEKLRVLNGLKCENEGPNSSQNISLVYTNSDEYSHSEEIAKFEVPKLTKKWSKIVIRVSTVDVILYLNCNEIGRKKMTRLPQELVFDTASTLYVAQAGPHIQEKYDVRAASQAKSENTLGMNLESVGNG
ncbi:hypothetical protein KQX54_014027 [Cotesia glomerata]|uniref:Uncharacterized protein n=1 Tax=Cotesia glomerata TaxID=32391 RepID=A0AAV7IBE0_COTGL|nr:hypothetical protein KQX54_014027 [Cotesia glomerata]